ncbi:unnamed protein product [Urochloa decumbens]|uniref:Glutathione transferase n=1 Tax=Urochloa decumbens TaxID=240449 RepID=A0ABC9GTL1_9POAL
MASGYSSNALQAIAGTGAVPEPPAKLKLYSFWRSSCSQRVRIALNLKEFEGLNPIKYVPALVDGDTVIADSFAILLYLEDMYPQHPLLPQDPQKRALNIQIASIVGSSIQPLQNYPVFNFIKDKLDSNEAVKWTQHHINRGFTALEKMLKGCDTTYATGNEIQLADVFLEPQIYGGIKRFGIDMSIYPILARLHEAYMEHPAFLDALPEKQPDAPSP